jgi:carbon monoxide dehydrogenase subunit G
MKFACRPVGLDFIESAPLRFVNEVEINASPEEVFKVLADAESWPRFLKDAIKAEWTSPEPHGVGSTRTLILKGMTAQEHFIAWEPGKRFTFFVPEITAPLARAICEDYRLEPAGRGKTRFTYVVACEPGLLLRLTGPFGRWLLGSMFRKVAHSLAAFLEEDGGRA